MLVTGGASLLARFAAGTAIVTRTSKSITMAAPEVEMDVDELEAEVSLKHL
jgi:hypothetical protein